MCRLFQKKELRPTDYPLLEISYRDVIAELEALDVVWQVKAQYKPDHLIRYTDLESWEKIAPFLVSPADRYISEACDCDDYAKMASAKAAMEFGRNGCLECYGYMKNDHASGSHAFNLIKAEQGYYLMEPNAGFPYAGLVFPFGEYGYDPKSWR